MVRARRLPDFFRPVPSDGLPDRRRVVRRQLPFFLAVLLIYGAILVLDDGIAHSGRVHAALAANAVLLGVCALVPWERLPRNASVVLPLLDFVLVAVLRAGVDTDLSVVAGLSIFPVIWLAVSGWAPRLAVPLGSLLVLVVMWAGHQASGNGMTSDFRSDLVLIPLMMVGVGLTVQAVTDRLRRQDTELRRLLAEGARRERLLDTVLDTVDVGIVAFDAAGQVVLMNRQQRLVHRLALPEGVDEADEADLLIYADAAGTPVPAQDRSGARALRGESFAGELVWIGRHPDQRVLSVSARPMRDECGRTEGAVLSLNDVTELIAAFRAKDEFLAGVSHELRTPLTSIRGYTELLAMAQDLPHDVRAGLEVIERNAEQLSTLIDDLLGTATGAAELQLRPTGLQEVVRRSVAAADVRAAQAGVELRVDVPPGLVVDCDPVRMGQVLDNLLSNAIKYSPGGGSVTVRADRSSGEARCQVVDQGQGISPQDAHHVFDRFFRSEDARSSTVAGLGLGLTIARSIVEQHGGRITCRSEPGEGTTFTVALPLRTEARAR